jgi:hypothetical protein
MSKKEIEGNIIKLSDTMLPRNLDRIEVVPYLNNDGDEMQDILLEIEFNTECLKNSFMSNNENNLIKINFRGVDS